MIAETFGFSGRDAAKLRMTRSPSMVAPRASPVAAGSARSGGARRLSTTSLDAKGDASGCRYGAALRRKLDHRARPAAA